MKLGHYRQTLLLYFVTALMLSMQSFALWHDIEHTFHVHHTDNQSNSHYDAHGNQLTDLSTLWHDVDTPTGEYNAQCERFEAFANNPSLDLVSPLLVTDTVFINVFITPTSLTAVSQKQRDAHAIRAPPLLLS